MQNLNPTAQNQNKNFGRRFQFMQKIIIKERKILNEQQFVLTLREKHLYDLKISIFIYSLKIEKLFTDNMQSKIEIVLSK